MTDFAELAARALKTRPTEARPEPSRDIAVASVAGALARRTRRATRRTWLVRGGMALAAAAGVALVLSSMARAGDACPAGVVCATLELADGRSSVFEPGEHVAVETHGKGTVSYENGTRIALDPRSYFEYREGARTRRFGLLQGAAHVHVMKLTPGERFVVETRDAEVEVKGTTFDVLAADHPECGELTRVAVHEGVVEVRAHGKSFRVPAGSSWPPECAAPAAPATAPLATAPASLPPVAALDEHKGVPSHAPPAAAPEAPKVVVPESPSPVASPASAPELMAASDLAEQNRMFGVAMQARRAGKLSSALASYEEFLAKYPSGPLSESARVERIRILAKLDPARARALAERYLAAYPHGFARAEARTIAEP